MNVLDTDQDGKVDLEEFKSFMLKANINDHCELSSECTKFDLLQSLTEMHGFVLYFTLFQLCSVASNEKNVTCR